jgi:hypothetical protein
MPTVNYRNQQFNFPDDATMEEIHNHLNRYDVMNPSTNLPNPTQPSSAENPIPQFSKRDAQNLGAKQAVGAAIPIVGGMLGGIPGAAMGSVVKNALQGYAPEFFGETPATTGGTISDIAKDTALQGIIPKAVSLIPGGISALAKRVTTDNPTVKQAITDKLTGMITPTEETLSRPETIPSIPTGVTQEQLALNQAIKAGYKSPSSVDLDAIEKELGGDRTTFYDKALSPETQDNLVNFLKKAKDLEPEKGSGGTDSMLRYAKHRLIFNIGAGLAGAIAGHATGAPFATEAGIVGSLYIGNKALTALMQSPTMGKLAIQALETPSGSEASKILSQALLYGMRGRDANFIDSEGNKEKVQISNDGQLQLKP